MRLWSIVVLSAVAGFAVTPFATAADMPVKGPVYKSPAAIVAYNWSGFYIGGHIGYLWGKTRVGAVAELVGNEGGVVSGVINLESSSVEAPDRRPRHDEHYHEA
jgi:opacity protein-like surface antigen